jgi:branched-chain amino acid transport system substrate-binding protein
MGHDYELVVEDSGCSGDQATILANKFVADPTILAVQGGMCTGETLALRPILEEAMIPFATGSSTNPDVTSEKFMTANRLVLSDKLQADVDAEFVFNELGITTLAIVHDNEDYGLGLGELIQDSFEALGGTVVGFEGGAVEQTDWRPLLTQLAVDSPGAIFYAGYATEAGLVNQQMGEVGLGDAVFFSGDGSMSNQFLDTAGEAAEGHYISTPKGEEDPDANAVFDAAYLDKFGSSPDDLGPFHANAYDAVRLLAAAIESVAVADDNGEGYLIIEREALVAAARATSGLKGLTGTLTCNAIGDCAAGGIQVFQVVNGEFELVYGFGAE